MMSIRAIITSPRRAKIVYFRGPRRLGRFHTLGAAALSAVFIFVSTGSTQPRSAGPAPVPEAPSPRPANVTRCADQELLPFLIRANFRFSDIKDARARREREDIHKQAIEYRTKNYGFFAGFGKKSWNAHPPSFFAKTTTFFGLKVLLHQRIHPALQCVEEQIRSQCKAFPYQPKRISGLRAKNTYHSGEISNHVYGIALDLDPTENTCCGCVPPWNENAKCKKPVSSIYERMVIPQCWVEVFERFGFYWLGRDKLQDTMHFEFLGDPDKILGPNPPAAHVP